MKTENRSQKRAYEAAKLTVLETEDVLRTSGETQKDPGIDLPLDPFNPVTKP